MAMELADFKTEATTLRNQDLTVRRLEERKKALEAQLAEKVGSGSEPAAMSRCHDIRVCGCQWQLAVEPTGKIIGFAFFVEEWLHRQHSFGSIHPGGTPVCDTLCCAPGQGARGGGGAAGGI